MSEPPKTTDELRSRITDEEMVALYQAYLESYADAKPGELVRVGEMLTELGDRMGLSPDDPERAGIDPKLVLTVGELRRRIKAAMAERGWVSDGQVTVIEGDRRRQ